MRTHLLIVAALLLAACGQSPDEVAVSAVSDGKVEKDGDKRTVQTEEGTVTYYTEASQALPANFPKDVFLPKDYSVRGWVEMVGALKVDFVVPGKSNDLYAATGAAMPGMGWKQTVASQHEGIPSSMLIFHKDARAVHYSFADYGSGKAIMSVNVMKNN